GTGWPLGASRGRAPARGTAGTSCGLPLEPRRAFGPHGLAASRGRPDYCPASAVSGPGGRSVASLGRVANEFRYPLGRQVFELAVVGIRQVVAPRALSQ